MHIALVYASYTSYPIISPNCLKGCVYIMFMQQLLCLPLITIIHSLQTKDHTSVSRKTSRQPTHASPPVFRMHLAAVPPICGRSMCATRVTF